MATIDANGDNQNQVALFSARPLKRKRGRDSIGYNKRVKTDDRSYWSELPLELWVRVIDSAKLSSSELATLMLVNKKMKSAVEMSCGWKAWTYIHSLELPTHQDLHTILPYCVRELLLYKNDRTKAKWLLQFIHLHHVHRNVIDSWYRMGCKYFSIIPLIIPYNGKLFHTGVPRWLWSFDYSMIKYELLCENYSIMIHVWKTHEIYPAIRSCMRMNCKNFLRHILNVHENHLENVYEIHDCFYDALKYGNIECAELLVTHLSAKNIAACGKGFRSSLFKGALQGFKPEHAADWLIKTFKFSMEEVHVAFGIFCLEHDINKLPAAKRWAETVLSYTEESSLT